MKTIKSPREFERVFSCGKRAYGSLVCIRVAKTCEDGEARVAFVAPKRLGNAVVRNRCKRVLREAARIKSLPVEGYGIILFATPRTHNASLQDVSRELQRLLGKVGIL